jgi:hypothetical protein
MAFVPSMSLLFLSFAKILFLELYIIPSGYKAQRGAKRGRTFLTRIRLHKPVSRTRLRKFWRQPCQLREVLVDEAHFGREAVLVDVES